MDKIIFLDVDGVLNDRPTYGHGIPTKIHLDCLKQIVDATSSKIVLSSDWRYYDDTMADITKSLASIGLEILDITEISENFWNLDENQIERYDEIKNWLKKHPDIKNFLILEDSQPMTEDLEKHLIRTSFEKGLLPEHVKKAIEILNN